MSFEVILQHVNRHIGLTAEEQDFFTGMLQLRKLRRKQFLQQEGDIPKGPTFVNKGLLRSYSLDKNGFEHVLQFAPAGWWIGDMQSFLTQKPGTLYIDALEETEVLWFWKADLDKLYAQVPKFERYFRILAENSIAKFQSRLVSMLSLPAAQRYNNFCELYPSLIQTLPQKQVASYIGVTPEFLSKMLSERK